MHPYNNQYYIEEVQELDMNTSRGEGGFGSTGK
jgi:dUTPase